MSQQVFDGKWKSQIIVFGAILRFILLNSSLLNVLDHCWWYLINCLTLSLHYLGMSAGATGAFVGTPAEVALIRMTSDGNLPAEQRRNYKSVFDAILRIFREEGLSALWRGAIPTMGRAMVVNAAQLASYSQAKQGILDSGYVSDGIFCHFLASMFSGLVTTAASMPVDIAKTRIQNQKYVDGKPEYKGAIDVIMKVVRSEGVTALWKGFTPYYFRLGPHTVLTFIFLEQMNKQYKIKVLGIKDAKGGGL